MHLQDELFHDFIIHTSFHYSFKNEENESSFFLNQRCMEIPCVSLNGTNMNAVRKLTLCVAFDNEFPLDYQNLTAISHLTKCF